MENWPRGRGFHRNQARGPGQAGGYRGGHHQEDTGRPQNAGGLQGTQVARGARGTQVARGARGTQVARGARGTQVARGGRGTQVAPGARGTQPEHRNDEPNHNWRARTRPHHENDNTNHQKQKRPDRTMGFPYVQKLLANEDLQEVILQLSNDKNGFSRLLSNEEPSNDLIILLVRLLCKVCGSTFQGVKIMIMSAALQSRFMEKLTLYITQLVTQTVADKRRNRCFWDDPDNFWLNLINFSKTVQEIIPTKCEIIKKLLKTLTIYFPHIEEAHSVHVSDEIKYQTKSMLDIVEQTIESIEVKAHRVQQTDVVLPEDMEPPDDFRYIEIIPSVQEIVSEESPFLRPNIVDRAYNSVDQYLDIQFRLLREDFVAPLRRGITTFLRNQTKPKKDWRKLDDVKIYTPVRFVSADTVNESYCYRLRFDTSKKKRSFKDENSKRFMFGSLVCFTCDNFKTLLFGQIVQRDPKLLEQSLLIVGFPERVEINYEMDYLMVESSVYFEPYYRVLGVLKKMDIESFPMEKYIIRVNSDSNPPQYLLQTEPVLYNIEGVKFWSLNFPTQKRFFGLNDSQLIAFRAALTEEFCIIQGPPGTGKTFLGLKIAHTLLNNRLAWYKKTPILVICYTNHALDQFLEGILPVTKHILRVGGQSKNEKLAEYNLANQRRRVSYQQAGAVIQKRREVQDYMKLISTLKDTLYQIELNQSIMSFSVFQEVVDDYEDTWFGQAKRDDIKKWLLEGKTRDREITRNEVALQQLPDGVQNIELADDTDDDDEDLGLEDGTRNADWLDDEFNNIRVLGCESFISVQQYKDKLAILYEALTKMANEVEDLELILRREKIQIEIWEAETDLDYISNQLGRFEDPRRRSQPRHIDLKNPFNMRPPDRWQLYFYWVDQYTAHLRRQYEEFGNRFREVYRVYSDMRDMEDTQLMKQHLVVGMTTTGAARLQSSLQALRNPIVIVEEAAEVLESHIVAALTNHCKHLILIGDHLQLKPGAADYRIEKKFKLGISLFERMVNNNIRCHTLNVQHRMKPEISKLIKPHIYQNLEDHETTLQRAPILGMEKCIYFIDHQEQEEQCQDSSKRNIHESQFLIALARHLVLNGYKPEQITILAAYLGQFFDMIREKKKPDNRLLLQDVRISVLDNYQGEESDIILLSLVRSNHENNAGFLKIQNRVCVALSRARDGFYIMGNMSLLLRCGSENQIWEKVKAVLEEQRAIGSHLTLRCQIHQYKFTQVSKSQDFIKLSEGGCDLMCERQVACGHFCKMLCHVRDRDHELYKCNEKCTRLLCNDPAHICKKLCYEDCGQCTYLVPRDLDCGHRVNIQCHIDLNQYTCRKLVSTKLPCDHQGDKPCWMTPVQFKCTQPCDTRVEPCGHACDWLCHIRMDPDHLQYRCKQPCAKLRIGCRAKDPKNQHVCTKLCFQDCEACVVGVKQTKSCGHVYLIPCRLDVEDLECEKPCKKNLPCGHPCKSKCFQACGECNKMVEKIMSECKHKIKIKCYKTPSRDDCKSPKCPRLLACGHKCTKPCKDPCTAHCTEIIDCTIPAPCGHTLTKIQCGLRNTNDAEVLLKFCNSPCETELKCKHKCSGTCGTCKQSRIHKRCAEKCGVPLVCNHECSIPCREACKPCTRPCNMRCKHNKCKKKCGEPCTECQSMCTRRCPHVRCSKPCGAICDVSPCTEGCPKNLKCGHPCVGFCGDPCPPLCRICNKEELTEIFFGSEDEEDAKFVLLNDCGHVLEESGLENWLSGGDYQIQFKTCPKCKANITSTDRYSDYVKRANEDIILAKTVSYGVTEDNENQRKELLNDLLALHQACPGSVLSGCFKLKHVRDGLQMRLELSRDERRQPINKAELNAVKSKIQTLFYIVDCFKDAKQFYINSKDPTIVQADLLLDTLLRSEDHVTNQEIEDLELEIKRLNRMVQLNNIKQSFKFENAYSLPPIKILTQNIEETLSVKRRYTNLLDNAIKINLKELAAKIDCTINISDKERMEIVKALGFEKGHWYKCPNGHPYAIGECGGAMQKARCLCGAEIGGSSHALLPSNQLAGEMDGSTRSAYPFGGGG